MQGRGLEGYSVEYFPCRTTGSEVAVAGITILFVLPFKLNVPPAKVAGLMPNDPDPKPKPSEPKAPLCDGWCLFIMTEEPRVIDELVSEDRNEPEGAGESGVDGVPFK